MTPEERAARLRRHQVAHWEGKLAEQMAERKANPKTNDDLMREYLADRPDILAIVDQNRADRARKKELMATMMSEAAAMDHPLSGELGVLKNGDGYSTEMSATTEMDGKHFNYPMLVTGQDPSAVKRILAQEATPADHRVAVQRYMERNRQRGYDPRGRRYETQEEAVAAAENRTDEEKNAHTRTPFTAVARPSALGPLNPAPRRYRGPLR